MASFSVEKLVASIEKGKVRGYDEVREIDGERYFFQCAIKKEGEKYIAYFFAFLKVKWMCLRIMQRKSLVSFQVWRRLLTIPG